jgi:transcriptional regulator with XRE-family HTH domain
VWTPPDEHKIVGRILADARQRQGMTQVVLAKRLQKPQSFVSSYESGQRRVDLLEMLRIARAIGVTPSDLLKEIVDRFADRPL